MGGNTIDVANDKDMDKEEMEKERAMYLRKVYRAYKEMREAVDRELRGMGVAGFCVGDEERNKISDEELKVLKGKVVALLEDLVAE